MVLLLQRNPGNDRAPLQALRKTSNKAPLEALQPTSSQARQTIQKANKKEDLIILRPGWGSI
jgi:hypothetical protein